MAEFDSSITAYIGGDYSGLTEAVTGAEGQIKQLDAKFETLGANMTKVPQAFAEENKKAMGQILSGEERLAAYREKTAFSRMTDEEKLAVLRAQGMGILDRINAIEGETVEKTGLKLQLEKKKTEIYDLNNKVTADGLVTQKESTEETGEHTKKATGLAGVVESIKKGFKDMGINLQGAGIGIAFAGFISLGKEAIANAQKQRDAYEAMGKPLEASTASLARMGDAMDGVKKAAVAFVGYTISGYTQMGELIGSTINGLRGISEAEEKNAEVSERAANAAEKRRDAARTEAMDVEKLHAAHKALGESQVAYAASKLNAENRYNALLTDAVRIQEKIHATKLMGIDPVKFETELLEKQKAIRAAGIAIIELESTKRIAAIEAAGSLDVTYEQRMATLKAARIVLEDTLRKNIEATGAKSAETGAAEIKLQENLRKQLSEQWDLIKKQGEDRAKVTLEGKEYERLLVLQLKAVMGLTIAEREELSLLQLKTKERAMSVQIEEAIAKRRTQTGAEVSAQEEKVLVELIKQHDKLGEQITAKETQAKKTNEDQLPAEEKITAELGKQTDEAKKRRTIEDAPPAPAAKPVDPFARTPGQTFGRAPDYQSMSTAMLQGIVQKQNDILGMIDYSGQQIRNATAQTGDNFARMMAESQKNAVMSELNLRKEIQEYGKRMGDIATIQKYGDAQTQRAFNAVTQGADKTNTMLARISQQLSASGIFGSGSGIG